MPRTCPLLGGTVVLACAPLLGGCSFSARLVLVPTIDTTRAPGFEAIVSLAAGLAISDGQAIVAPVSVGGGFRRTSSVAAVVPVDVGLDYVHLGQEPRQLGFRGGVYERTRVDPSFGTPSAGVATQAALLATMLRERDGGPRAPTHFLALGPVLDASVQVPPPGTPALGAAGLGLSIEYYRLGSTFLP